MMGGQSSKTNNGGASKSGSSPPPPPPPPPPEGNRNSEFSADLSSYEAACGFDPTLQSFDALIQERTNRVIGTLATGFEVRSLSFNSLKEVADCLLEMNQEVVKVILENKRDIWNNKDMFSLVEQYFENSIQTLDFCTALERCLKRTTGNQLILRAAVSRFQEELEGGEANVGSFEKTLQELAKFKAAGDPFTDEFFALFKSVLDQQFVMLEKLQTRKKKLDKKLKSLKTWRKVSNVIFVATFVSVLIFSVVAAAIAAPPVVIAVLGALSIPIGSMGKWCNSLWTRYGNVVRGQREIISSMEVGTSITLHDLSSIKALIGKLENEIESMLHNAQFALMEDGALKIGMEEIKKRLEDFTETTEKLSRQNERCIQDITMARKVIVQRIMKHPPS